MRETFAGIAIDDANINAGKRAANTVASDRQRLGCIRDAAISVGLREAVDVADFARAEFDDAHVDIQRGLGEGSVS